MDLLETQKYLAQIICHTPGDGKLSWSLGSNAWPLLHGAVIPQDIFRTELHEHTYNLRSNTQVNLFNTQYSLVWLHEQTLSHPICIWPAYLLTRHPTLPNCIQPTTVHVCSCLFHPYFMLSKMTSMWDPSWEWVNRSGAPPHSSRPRCTSQRCLELVLNLKIASLGDDCDVQGQARITATEWGMNMIRHIKVECRYNVSQ
jgi:hypothetical protein